MKAASTDDRFQDDKEGGPILTEGALSSRYLTGRMGPGGAHLPSKMGPGGPIEGGPQNFMTPGQPLRRTSMSLIWHTPRIVHVLIALQVFCVNSQFLLLCFRAVATGPVGQVFTGPLFLHDNQLFIQ